VTIQTTIFQIGSRSFFIFNYSTDIFLRILMYLNQNSNKLFLCYITLCTKDKTIFKDYFILINYYKNFNNLETTYHFIRILI